MPDDREGTVDGAPPARRLLAWGGAGVLLIAVSIPAAGFGEADSGAERAGRVVGTLVAAIAIALALRLLWVKAVRRRSGLRVWSPWVLVVAAAVALFSVLGQAARTEATEDIDECVRGGMAEYDGVSSAEAAALRETGLTRPHVERIIIRACERVMEDVEDPGQVTASELQPITVEVMREMCAGDELPRRFCARLETG